MSKVAYCVTTANGFKFITRRKKCAYKEKHNTVYHLLSGDIKFIYIDLRCRLYNLTVKQVNKTNKTK